MFSSNKIRKALAISAHPDDSELSCGGSLLKLKREYNVDIFQIVCSLGELKSNPNIRKSEQIEASRYLGVVECFFLDYSDGNISFNSSLVTTLEKYITSISPDIIFTHLTTDVHQDHRNVGLATISACRRFRANILEYPSLFTRDRIIENFFVDITAYFDKKLKLLSIFKSQKENEYMDKNVVKVRARDAGLQCKNMYAEEFLLSFGVA